MYKCKECKERFFEPSFKITTYEEYYGIDGGHTPLYLSLCPYCRSEKIEEIEMEETEDEQCDVDRENN